MNTSLKILLGATTLTVALATSAQAQTLMLNFRSSGGPTGANLTNSPLHTSEPSFTDTSWNNISNSDVGSGLLYADGTAATGVAFDLGIANLDVSTTVDLATTPTSANNLGLQANTGVYEGNSVGTGGIFSGSGPDRNQIGLQVTGLAAGTYEIYITGRNTNGQSTGELLYSYYAGTGVAGSNFDFSGYDSSSVSFMGSDQTAAWVDGGNYGKITITLAAGEALNIVSNGDGGKATGSSSFGTANRGFLNSVQISMIPEPQTWALIIGLVSLGVLALRRRK
ncbi:PEP-CTERM sorting domain-containing protein [Cerasicoccus fimbriatus]|uniref:PEP-CTERM sorting domain-containing protein n=1 Tax=Cerasicoccus fimbriatus TaxID=3014554 RepID=UPI0022B2E9CC|nr:PEP-CTERM sorting domain-containing protein [Cerasicoccus sp. TK19100]